jgi:hypothetical protein
VWQGRKPPSNPPARCAGANRCIANRSLSSHHAGKKIEYGDVAQTVERVLSMHEAQGPIPCFSSFDSVFSPYPITLIGRTTFGSQDQYYFVFSFCSPFLGRLFLCVLFLALFSLFSRAFLALRQFVVLALTVLYIIEPHISWRSTWKKSYTAENRTRVSGMIGKNTHHYT